MRKLTLLFIALLTWNTNAQHNRQEEPIQAVPPTPPGCRIFFQIDDNNDGYAILNIALAIDFVRYEALHRRGYNLSGYTLKIYNNSGEITTPTYTNTVIHEEFIGVEFFYSGSGPQYNPNDLSRFSCYKMVVLNHNADYDSDGILNSAEDVNNNLFVMDDNTDGDEWSNVWDSDDDGDGILTINEDYNGNGNPADDDMNGNGIPDYLDNTARGSLPLNLKLFIEGYYAGSGMMHSVRFNQDGVSPTTDVENITIELHRTTAPYALVASATAMLKTNGSVSCNFPTASVGLYYIAIKSRNVIETWSATPQSISNVALTYNLSNAANKAFGNNMIHLGSGVYGLYSGDVNQDSLIDPADYSEWETDNNNFAFGSKSTDFNGDGLVDPSDYSIWETNNNGFIFANKPQ